MDGRRRLQPSQGQQSEPRECDEHHQASPSSGFVREAIRVNRANVAGFRLGSLGVSPSRLSFSLDEVSEPRALVITHRHLKGNGVVARNSNELADLVDGYLHLLCDFFWCGLAADFPREIAAGADELTD